MIGLNPVFLGNMPPTEKIRGNLLVSPVAAEVHSPISINGDAELTAFCAGNDTDGLSWATAHMIKDYEINAGGSG